MKAALRDAMNRRFGSVKTTLHITAATLLDPRFKDAYLNRHEAAVAKAEISEFLRSVQVTTPTANQSQPGPSSAVGQSADATANVIATSSPNSPAALSLWDAHDSMPVATVSEDNETASEPAYERQLEAYSKEPRVPPSTNIYAYWHCSQFPDLEEAAHKYLSAPPTSVASEQLFSSAGQLYADRRSSLLGENADKLLFLAYNIRLFDFTY